MGQMRIFHPGAHGQGDACGLKTKTSFAPVGKMPQVFEAKLSEESTTGSAPSLANTESLVRGLEPCQEGPQTCTPEPSIQGEEYKEWSLLATLEWLVTCEHGFCCLACCCVFESREALVAHAEHGVNQSFRCQVFYEELLEKRQPPSVQHRPRCCHQLARCRLMAAKKREVREKRVVCRCLEEQLEKYQWERLQKQEARLHSTKARGGST